MKNLYGKLIAVTFNRFYGILCAMYKNHILKKKNDFNDFPFNIVYRSEQLHF